MQYNDNRTLSINFQVFQDWILGHEHDLSISQRGRGDRNSTVLTCMLMTDFFHQELTTVWKSLYDTSGTGYNVLAFGYGPGDHWRYEIGSAFFYSYVRVQEPAYFDKDMFYFRLKYEW
jgi:hypothetical protein